MNYPDRLVYANVHKPFARILKYENHFYNLTGLIIIPASGHSLGHLHKEDKVLITEGLYTSKNGKLKSSMKIFRINHRNQEKKLLRNLNLKLLVYDTAKIYLHDLNMLEGKI